ncbi:MAG: acyl-CoA dehydrogenase family protein [Natronomonas sp.]
MVGRGRCVAVVDATDRRPPDRGGDPGRELSMAKIDATEIAVEVTNEASCCTVASSTAARGVFRHLRDARLLTIAGGANEQHRDVLADVVWEN